MCGVVPGQSAPLMETGRPFQTPTVFRQLQTQSAESISSEQTVTQAGLPSAALPLNSVVLWKKGRWNTLFITGVSQVPSRRHTKERGRFLLHTCIATRCFTLACDDSASFHFVAPCIQDIAWCKWPFWLLCATSRHATSTWAICEERRIQSLWLAVPPERLRRQWANTGTKHRAKLQGESGAPVLLLFCVTDHRTAIYFNDVNEQWCRVDLLERLLILPGGDVKHQGWPPQPAIWKRQCSSLFTFVWV